MQFDSIEFIKSLCQLGTRQLEQEAKAAELIIFELEKNNVKYLVQRFQTKVPNTIKAKLVVDGQEIKVKGTGFKSGQINSKETVLSSLISSQKNIDDANINFNPECNVISCSNFYFAPALAINKKDLEKVVNATKVEGELEVEAVDFESKNIIIGNFETPENFFFCHYDSIGPGAIDNASGVAVCLDLIINHSKILEKSLFVIAGNEELSYDYPVYWGHGYRSFENEYQYLFETVKKINIIDCVGNDVLNFSENPELIKLGFSIKNLGQYIHKIKMFYGNMDNLMEVYHSEADLPEMVKKEYLEQTVNFFIKNHV